MNRHAFSLASALFLLSLPVCPLMADDSRQYLSRITLDALHLSDDGGVTWRSMDILPQLNGSTYLTATDRNPSDPARILAGTSFEGIYESTDGGKTWKFLSESRFFAPLYQGAGFYDEVDALHYLEGPDCDFVFRIAFGGGLYRYTRKTHKVDAVPPGSPLAASLPQWLSAPAAPRPSLPVWEPYLPGHDQATVQGTPSWQPGLDASLIKELRDDPDRMDRRKKASDRTGIYLNAGKASVSNLKKYFTLLKSNGMNSVVVDFKDDYGRLTYKSALKDIVASGGTVDLIDAPALIKSAHEAGVYVIARVVIFKDRHLYRQNGNSMAIWDKRRNAPWGVFRTETVEATDKEPESTRTVQTEYWVDPYDSRVHDYNIRILKEIESLGVDEIQLDYIRFPSDGNTRDILCRAHKDANGKTIAADTPPQRVQALASFLYKARKAVSIPLGTDVFGFNSWARMSYLGQDIQVFSWFVDVISPMNYPSHYARDFLQSMKYMERAEYIYGKGTDRAIGITGGRVIIRPYVQAFLLGGERNFSDPQIYDYLNRQIKGLAANGGSGFTLWNNMGNYYMIDPKSFQASFTPSGSRQ